MTAIVATAPSDTVGPHGSRFLKELSSWPQVPVIGHRHRGPHDERRGDDDMDTKKRLVLGAVGIAAVASLGTWGVIAATDDPDEDVETVLLDNVATQNGGDDLNDDDGDGNGDGDDRPVTALEALSGTVELVPDDDGDDDADDAIDLRVDGVELDFGPDEWVLDAEATDDLDGDGDTEALATELEGLVGQDVGLQVGYDDGERDDADVYEVNGTVFRELGGPAPWDADGDAAEATQDDVARAAEAEIGDGARAVEVDRDDEDGSLTWEVDVVDADGREHTVVLNGAGEVLGSEADD
jgi:hypothetical protein